MKLKQLLSVVLMLCMVASSCVAFAAPQFDAAYECSGVSFGYQDGETWTDADSLKGGQEISAKVSVSKTGDKENAVFSLFVYKNGKMYDIVCGTFLVTGLGAEDLTSLPPDLLEKYYRHFQAIEYFF